jgi:hypothetical protein
LPPSASRFYNGYEEPGYSHRKGGTTLESERRQAIIGTLRAVSIIGIGFGAGILSGLLGVGGGFILVPAMVYLIGLTQHQAHGTSLAAITFIVLLGAITYNANGEMNWLIAAELAVGGVFGAMIGARICNKISARHLRRYFGIFLMVVAGRMVWDVIAAKFGGAPVNSHMSLISPHGLGALAVIGVGVFTGILSGLMGVGGGIIMIPAMIYLMGLSQKLAQGISLAVIIPVSISGALIHASHGNVRKEVGVWLVVGGVSGGLIGAWLAMRLPSDILRATFGAFLIILGGMMATKRDKVDAEPSSA